MSERDVARARAEKIAEWVATNSIDAICIEFLMRENALTRAEATRTLMELKRIVNELVRVESQP